MSDGGLMPCDACSSPNVTEFTVEMMIHFMDIQSARNPGVFAFPQVYMCLDCGAARFTTPDSELRILRERMRPSAA